MTNSPFDTLIAQLREDVTVQGLSIDAPTSSGGEWWLDIELEGGWSTSLSWRSDRKFGVYVAADGFGERPDEIFSDSRLVATRLLQLLRRHQAHEVVGAALSLREIRQLLGGSQEQLAVNLGKGQAEISRLEKRSDAKLSTIDQYVRSLGGMLKVSVVFDDFEGALALTEAPKTDRARRKRPVPKRKQAQAA